MAGKDSEDKLVSSVGLLIREMRTLIGVITESRTEVDELKQKMDYDFETATSGIPDRVEAIEGFLKEVFPKKEG